ncbi:MAG TPA: transposase [Nitrosospira sp.]|nr:transposase [Nitrosospira sp.]
MQMSFGAMEMDARVGRDSALLKVHALIDWEGLRVELLELCKREANRAERQKSVDPLTMFKAVLLGQWHSLSDLKLEEALRVRIDFMYFCGLSLANDVPDEALLYRFRSFLITTHKLGGLLGLINAQLQAHGLMVKHAYGAVIDATLVQLADRSKCSAIAEPNAVNEEGSIPDGVTSALPQLSNSAAVGNADLDATWIKKGTYI